MEVSRPSDHQRRNSCSMRPRYRRTAAPVLLYRHIFEHCMRNIDATIDESKPLSRHLCLGARACAAASTAAGTTAGTIAGTAAGAINSAPAVRIDMIEVEIRRRHDFSQADQRPLGVHTSRRPENHDARIESIEGAYPDYGESRCHCGIQLCIRRRNGEHFAAHDRRPVSINIQRCTVMTEQVAQPQPANILEDP